MHKVLLVASTSLSSPDHGRDVGESLYMRGPLSDQSWRTVIINVPRDYCVEEYGWHILLGTLPQEVRSGEAYVEGELKYGAFTFALPPDYASVKPFSLPYSSAIHDSQPSTFTS